MSTRHRPHAARAGRPAGVAILAVLGFVAGLLGLVAALEALGAGGALLVGHRHALRPYGAELGAVGVVILIIALLQLACARGYWALEGWAWPLGLALQIVGVVQDAALGATARIGVWQALVAVVVHLAVVCYLLRHDVRAAFSQVGPRGPDGSRPVADAAGTTDTSVDGVVGAFGPGPSSREAKV